MNKIENYLGIANHDIQMANNSQELKSYVASILCENDELQQENEKNKHYKTLYQSLKRQKEELRSWLKEDKDKITVLDTKDNSSVRLGIMLGMGLCLEKLEELEGVDDGKIN